MSVTSTHQSIQPVVRCVAERDEVFVNAGGEVTDECVWRESWEENVYRIFPDKLLGGVVVDLGANIGAFTTLVCAINPLERVVAYEPNGPNRHILRRNLELNGFQHRVEVHPEAVGGGRGRGSMHGGGGASTLIGGDDVDVISLADVFARIDGFDEVDVLKVDVEGAEWDVFRGSSAFMLAVRWLVMEFHQTTDEVFGLFLAELARTHSYSLIGHAGTGGMLWAHRHDV